MTNYRTIHDENDRCRACGAPSAVEQALRAGGHRWVTTGAQCSAGCLEGGAISLDDINAALAAHIKQPPPTG